MAVFCLGLMEYLGSVFGRKVSLGIILGWFLFLKNNYYVPCFIFIDMWVLLIYSIVLFCLNNAENKFSETWITFRKIKLSDSYFLI